MYAIAQPVGVCNEGLIEVNEFEPLGLGYAFDGLGDFSAPKFGAGVETRMVVADGGEARQNDANFRIDLSERIHQRHIVAHKFITKIRPIARVGVVDA